MTTSNQQPRDEWEAVQDLFQAGETSVAEPFHQVLRDFRRDLGHHPYVRRQASGARWAPSLRWLWAKRLLAPATTLAALVLALSFFSRPALTWGQVKARFQEMTFFSASIYSKEDGLSRPEHIELWMGQGGRVRVRVGQQLIFANRGEILAAFDLKTRKQTDPNAMAVGIIKILGPDETFSMDTVLRTLTRGGPVNRTPVLNENAMVAEDLAVFDLEAEDHDTWFRIWALKSSGLPVRMRMWNPEDAASLEVVFDYSRPQPERFFDPKAFGAVLGTVRTDQLNLAYLHLQDPGGRSYAPGIKDQDQAMAIVTTTLEGEPFSLSHYADKTLVLYFWNRDVDQRDWDWLRQKRDLYRGSPDVQFAVVALDKKHDRVAQQFKGQKLDITVLHEPGRGGGNRLAHALGVTRTPCYWLLRKGQALAMQSVPALNDEILYLACRGLDYQSARWLNTSVTMLETTQEEMLDLCGTPHETETVDGRELWTYRFISPDNESRKVVTIRFDQAGRYSGIAVSTRLINPSHVSLKLGRAFWEREIVTGLGRENMPEANPHHHMVIWFKRSRGGGPVIGGGHPRVEIVPETLYEQELAPGSYRVMIQLIDDKDNGYRYVKDLEILPELVIGKNESVDLFFQDTDGPEITRSSYQVVDRDLGAENKQRMLKKTDWKARIKQANQEEPSYDDPKYLPWQLHLKEISARYASSPLPERMALFPKETDETYALTMFPKNLPGHAGYSAVSLEGDLKAHCLHILGPGVTRWPDDTPTTELNHDLVYRDEISLCERYTFILEQLGYDIEKTVEEREVYVATYDGRTLPAAETVSAPHANGWGYFTAEVLVNMLTRRHNRDSLAQGPVFIDETGLASAPGPGQTHEDIAISMELPDTDQDFEALRPWFADTFGITFTHQIRPLEVFVIRK